MADRTKDKPSTSQNPPLQPESSNSPFIDIVRSVLKRDRKTSPFTPEQSTQTLEESRRIIIRAYGHQLGLTPIDYGLPRKQRRNTHLTKINQDSAKACISQSRNPSHQVRSLHKEITRENNVRGLTSLCSFGEPPSPLESPPDSPMSFNQESSSY